MHTRHTLLLLTVSLATGCAQQPDQTEVSTQHPAHADAAQAPAPPASHTLTLPAGGDSPRATAATDAAAPDDVHAQHDPHVANGVHSPTADRSSATTTPTAPRGSGATVGGTVYTCPHHPEVTSDRPGECPKCNMKLVAKK